MEAISQAGSAIGILANDGVLLAAEKRVTSKLLDIRKATEKIYTIDDHIATAVAGITADANVLINYTRLRAQQYAYQYQEPIPIERLLHHVCDLKQEYTQFGGKRPFGVSFLFSGWDQHYGFQLYQSDPSGNYNGWKATAIGSNSQAAQSILKSDYKEGEMTLEQAKLLAIKVLNKTMDTTSPTAEKLEFSTLTRDAKGQVVHSILTKKELQALLDEAAKQGLTGSGAGSATSSDDKRFVMASDQAALQARAQERDALEKVCCRLASCLQQMCTRLATIEEENELIRARLKAYPGVDKPDRFSKSNMERTKYYAYIDFENHYKFGSHPNVRTESHLSIPSVMREILDRLADALWADCQIDLLPTLHSRFIRTMNGFKNKKAPKQIMTSRTGEQFFIRADRRDHLQSLYGPGREGMLNQLGLCPLLVRVGCEASKMAEAQDDVCAPRPSICTCNI
ncbi:unnamed protein product (mitochondrion) [Plasmodiophora brassicae]|nr:unnamed protein product [Plasmodiophora brassicae]